MNLYFIILVFILLSVVSIFIYSEFKDRKLLKTVTNLNRGTKSERIMVLKILKSGIKSTAIFHDIYLNNGNGKYSQIDLVVATKVGIVVFEVKEYSGWIFGNENQINWTQILAYGKRKYKFYNPILQNKKHVEDLKKFYHFDNIPVFSLIVFFGDCEFKNLIDLPSQTILTKSNKVMKIFNEILENNQPAKYENKWEIANLLKQAVNNGENSLIREKHIENIEKLKARNRYY
ncbi:NERD domain-containing protein [Flavobacterium sp. LMO8]|uniref:nuclease-related domain-containing protein n=1 Tax=Flavobacterium sp. LMO8 TaxID=2654244 RepID=UPI001290C968|nr:nuclease-related domain-containing protein [Flavobacterium sp. LMO8]MQP23808.1 NERD domain-containing protein [Flavobacterium sp. LMO8]